MTLQDFTGAINSSIISSLSILLSFLLPLLIGIFVFLLGLVFGQLLNFSLSEVFKFLNLEKILERVNFYRDFSKERPDLALTQLVFKIVWFIVLSLFLLASLQIAGYKDTEFIFNQFNQFFPKFIQGGLFLITGSLLAYLIYVITSALAILSKFPLAELLAKTLATILIVFSFIQALFAFGVTSEFFRYILIGLILTAFLTLSWVLKDTLAETIRKIKQIKL